MDKILAESDDVLFIIPFFLKYYMGVINRTDKINGKF